MHSSVCRSFHQFAFLVVLGALISTPCLAGTLAGSEGVTAQINAMAKRQTSTPIVPVKPRLLEIKKIPAVRLEKLNADARTKYELAMKAIDKINYEKAAEYFQQSVQAQPDDVYLRFQLVTLAQYLGDTHTGKNPDPNRSGDEGIKFYDLAIENLQAMITSTMLNSREKQRAQGALETMVALRQSIGEREEKRRQAGMEMAKKYNEEAFREMNARERERENRIDAVENYVKEVNNPSYLKARQAVGGAILNRASQTRGASGSGARASGSRASSSRR